MTVSPNALADEGEQQAQTVEERAETHRKRKPKIAEREGIRAALRAMKNNGALDRAKTRQARRALRRSNRIAARAVQDTSTSSNEHVPIKHVLTCDTKQNCQNAHDWSIENGFDSKGVLMSNGHGGEILYHLFLRQAVASDEDTIANESTRVHAGIQSLDGIRYATWMVDFDPEGSRDTEAE